MGYAMLYFLFFCQIKIPQTVPVCVKIKLKTLDICMSVSVPNKCLKTIGFRYYMYMYSLSSTPI